MDKSFKQQQYLIRLKVRHQFLTQKHRVSSEEQTYVFHKAGGVSLLYINFNFTTFKLILELGPVWKSFNNKKIFFILEVIPLHSSSGIQFFYFYRSFDFLTTLKFVIVQWGILPYGIFDSNLLLDLNNIILQQTEV